MKQRMARMLSDEHTEDSDVRGSHASGSQSVAPDVSASPTPGRSSLTDSLPSVQRTAADTATGPQTDGPATPGQYVQRYGVDIDTPGQEDRLQRLEQSNSLATVQRWADEGIPIDAMGTPSKMEAYRQREGTPVPWDVEQRNEQSLQRSKRAADDTSPAGETQVPDSVRDVVSSPGQPVDAALRKPVESEIGQSLEHARVHRSPAADAACEQLNASAFALNNHIAVRSDQPDPTTPAGQHLMSHELAHVAQQTGGAVSLLPDTGTLEVDPDPKLEREAEETAQRVMQGGELGIQRMSDTGVHIQRGCFGCFSGKWKKYRSGPSTSTPAQQPGASAPTVGPSTSNGLLSKAEFDERGARLRGEGRGPDGRAIPGAEQQLGESCSLAALQAAWAALGADTSTLRLIIAAFPTNELLNRTDVHLSEALKRTKILNDDTKKEVYNVVQDNLRYLSSAGRDPENRMRTPIIKNTAVAYGLLSQFFEDQQKGSGRGCSGPKITAEDVQIAGNLLDEVCNFGGDVGTDRSLPLGPSINMTELKKTFMRIVDMFGTPLRLGLHTRYTRTGFGARVDTDPHLQQSLSSQSITPGPVIEELPGGHDALIAGITEENGTVYVMYRDGHQKGGTYDIQTLDEFLTPRFIPAIRTILKREPELRDELSVRKMKQTDNMSALLTNR